MPIVTKWTKGSSVRLHQLSDDPQDGTASEQIAHLATLAPYAGYQCVDSDYTGPAPVVVPASVTPRQVRLLLLAQGLLESVEAMIASSTEDVRITWQYAQEFKRNDPLLTQLGANLGLTSEQIDQFFIDAAAL